MKHSIKALSLVLALVLAAVMPMQAFAASGGTRYISEVVTVAAGSPDEARTKLKDAGYIPVDGNLNSTLKTGVYLGYKETENRAEAITDIAAMNMLGKFSYSDYKQIMEDYQESIEKVVADIETFIEEYRQGCDNELKNAALARTALNLFKDEDSGKLMGEYFYDYDFSEEANKTLTDMLMQASDEIVMSMIRVLSFAGDPDDTTLVSRMSQVGPNGLAKKYEKSFPTHAAFEAEMAKRYGAVADTLYKDWNYFYEYLLEIEKNVAVTDGQGSIKLKDGAFDATQPEALDTTGLTEEQVGVLEQLDEQAQIPEVIDSTTDFGFYTLLFSTKYGSGTLLDFFKRPSAEVDKSELYVLADCMSDGQKKQVDFVGIREILQSAFSGEEEPEGDVSEAVGQYEELTEEVEPISIYTGVDRSVFEDGVAFTSSAVNHEVTADQSWLEKLGGIVTFDSSYWNPVTVTCWAATCAMPAIAIAATMVRKSALKKLPEATAKFEAAQKEYFEQFQKYMDRWDGGNPTLSEAENMAGFEEMFPRYGRRYDLYKSRYDSVQRTIKFSMAIKVASLVLLVVALGYNIYTLVDYFKQEKPVEENIPHHIMGTAMTAYGEDYVYYQTVKTLDGKAADMNNHEADAATGWLVLYTTRDANAGDPICADDIKIKIGSKEFGETASFAHMFNETAAVNLTDALYTGKEDKAGGTYVIFKREAASAYAGSAISGGVAAIIATLSLIVGAAGGSIVTAAVSKKKKRVA